MQLSTRRKGLRLQLGGQGRAKTRSHKTYFRWNNSFYLRCEVFYSCWSSRLNCWNLLVTVVVLQSSDIHLLDQLRCLSAAVLRQSLLMFAEKTQPKSMFCSAFGGLSSRAHLLLMGFSFFLFSYSLCILAHRFLEKKKRKSTSWGGSSITVWVNMKM